MIRQPTLAEINAVLGATTPTLAALDALLIPAAVSTANEESTEAPNCIACKRCRKSRYLRNCVGLVNCSHCDDSTWLGGALEINGCHWCTDCHGTEGAPAQRLYGCSNLHGVSRAYKTHNISIAGAENLVFGLQVTQAKFNVLWTLVQAWVAAEAAAEAGGG